MRHKPIEPSSKPGADDKFMARYFGLETAGGRLLLALRAGRMDGDQLTQRLGHSLSDAMRRAIRCGFIRHCPEDGYTYLNDAGLAACPKRRAGHA